MLWCAVCCEPYHSFCLHPDDLPLSWDGGLGEKLQDWICRRCSICQVCGLPGDIARADSLTDERDEKTDVSESDECGEADKSKKDDKICKINSGSQLKRERLRCKGCAGVFHSDCLQPSQHKMIKAQGSQWVR